ncbi:MAG: Vgb family protein [Vulcanimicrobiaceae bacterium]
MKRLGAIAVVITALCFTGCSGGAGSGSGNVSPANNDLSSGPLPPTTQGGRIREHATKDALIGGMTIGDDGNLYATTAIAVDVFIPRTLMTTQSTAAVRPFTWPNVHALVPTGPVSHGPQGTVFALGQLTGTPPPASAQPSNLAASDAKNNAFTPALAKFTIATNTWAPVSYGKPGDVYEHLTEALDGAMWVSANTPTSNGLEGFVFTTKAGCASPQFSAALGAITTGPDGGIWVASDPGLNARSPSQVYRIDPTSGLVTQSITLPSDVRVSDMTAGPDGAMWFTDNQRNQIGRFTLSGSVTFFHIPTPNSKPTTITVGCDGALWFTEKSGNKIGRITTAGSVTEFKALTANADLGRIVRCLNGSLFFTEKHAIGEVTQ